ncbi:terminase small subunit [Paraburkholderia sp. Ac-20342]|uniref:hypothetical protein n=1 Tax=Paraburkholderia sp. Ac-20342 TaxID=2703889 RepID=UPI0019811B7F|nr:hypothetical protein [Paraburkholderia sp. Ac-20342]MBN3848361.1 terminase small subunit [Paraburkholderia sp. Ac-20342]
MAKRTDPAPAASVGLSKRELCALLGWSRPTLDHRLEIDRLFPVLQRGSRGVQWQFEGAAVMRYLSPSKGDGKTDTPFDAEDGGNIDPSASVGRRAVHEGEQTARQRRDAVQAEILEDKLRRDRGELVQAEIMRQVITKMLVHLGKGLDRLSDQVVEKLGLPESSADSIRELTDDLRVTMVAELNVLLEPESRSSPRPAVGQNTGSRR